ncbi:MAG: T9SS type A sorting domain-containing protein [Bacteroidales bacterium]|nr:T9SS type A sorting domain-containing protein [Bacteroidales bacterium]
MAKKLLLFSLILLFGITSRAQINGAIVADTNNIQIIKLWGTHQERGFAYGYLIGNQINTLFNGYLKPQFGAYYSYARNIIAVGQDIQIDSMYILEAEAIVAGMDSAGKNTFQMDYIDLLVCNSFLDVSKLMSKNTGMGCSSLISWGDASAGTSLNGNASLARHLDWTTSSILTNNQVLFIHLPSEANEQNWAGIGFAGMFSVLSGFNANTGVFQHMMDDFSGNAVHGKHYEPIWFSLRKALEMTDFNQDGTQDVNDTKEVLSAQTDGYADGFIISCIASNPENIDTLTALMAEIAPQSPFLTFRSNVYEDSIPGDNLYTANYQIARDSALHFCSRYNGIRSAIGDGTLIGLDEQWAAMRDYSHLSHNIQFMQYAPAADYLRLACYASSTAAYLKVPMELSIQELFSPYTPISIHGPKPSKFKLHPNPANDYLRIQLHQKDSDLEYSILSSDGKLLSSQKLCSGIQEFKLSVQSLSDGLYYLHIKGKTFDATEKFIIQRN